MAQVEVYPDCAEIVAHLPGVRVAVRAEAQKGGGRAAAKLAAHRRTGASKIEVSSGSVDSFVSLDDTAGAKAAWMINIETGALGAAF